jgi:integrase
MNSLAEELERYLKIRRALGFKLDTAARILRRFLSFAEQEHADYITTDLFLRWQKAFGHAHRGTWAARLGMVHLFAEWLHGIDARNEVPPRSLIPLRIRRSRPYIYSREEIQRIICAAADLPSIYGLRGLTYSTFLGLVAATGLRISEAILLDVGDVDLTSGVITIRHGKHGNSRYNPISESTKARLTAYSKECVRLFGGHNEAFFISEEGKRLSDSCVRYNFSLVCKNIGMRPAQHFHRHGRGPRIHDLRHTFAVHTMLNWYRSGKDAAAEMIKLTTYLGHANPSSTYWYIEAIPELLELASQMAQAQQAKEEKV